MANLVLAKMLFGTAFDVNPSAGSSGLANLGTPDPKEIAIMGAGGGAWDIDLGQAMNIDTAFLGFISSQFDYAASLHSGTSLGGGLVLRGTLSVGPQDARRRHAFVKLGAPVSSRYWRITATGSGGANITAGILGLGLAVQPTWGHEWGSGRQPIDSGVVSSLRGGGFSVELGAVKGAWQFTTGDLTDADLKALWALTLDIGISSPVLAVEDPALAEPDLNDGLHYGLLQRPEAYERQLGGHRWAWRVEEWV